MTAIRPPWLPQADPGQGVQQQPQVRTRVRVAPAPKRAVAPPAQAPDSYGFAVPAQWPFDGGVRREPVLDCDHGAVREVRKVGWRCCMKCAEPFFSADVVRQRLCLLHRRSEE